MKNSRINEKEIQYLFNVSESDVIVESPGRINLIGEHIDYNGGFVLPAAIDKKITFFFKKNDSDSVCNIQSVNYNSAFQLNLNSLNKSENSWENYILGVLFGISQLKPNHLKGFDCIIQSELPIGSGISSSAALECGMAKGISNLFNLQLTDIEIIKLSRDAEHSFVGTKCGIMDQFAVTKGVENNFILLDCDTLEYDLIETDLEPYTILLLNTNVSHNLATSSYNKRREECDTALSIIKSKINSAINTLVEITEEELLQNKHLFPEKIFNRALYVTQENQRVLKAVKALKNNSIQEIGSLLYQSHEGLQNLYEVSCEQLDFMVEFSKKFDFVKGSRMMGGGFGGCTINLIHKDKTEEYIGEISEAYKNKFSISLTPIHVSVSEGVSIKKI
ncbi:galactokinase [Abyssalbus ytuae]|uniref:Galactokinase n=1 Tax=Abyssalbus ytuae TaxID=2926907 RepID=A0A9E6ZQD2_9FLAO|nr:galactokinase [Abyssalbus ytuae]UOB18645.1 galactokinase [Abyssalbus ytuae]